MSEPESVYLRSTKCEELELPEETLHVEEEELENPMAFSILAHGYQLYTYPIYPMHSTVKVSKLRQYLIKFSCNILHPGKFHYNNLFLVFSDGRQLELLLRAGSI